MTKKAKKKDWKDKQRKRQIRQQRAQEASQKQKRDEKAKPRKFPMQKLLVGVALIVLILTAYGIWQYYEGQKPPTIGGASGTVSPSTASATDFSLRDIDGTQVSLSQFDGRVIGIHFMAVGCGGQMYGVNQYQLTQLKSLCNSLCSDDSVTFLTVAVATCENSLLDQIRANYGITWAFGNDYSDGVLDIVNAYVPHEIGDGSVVLIDKDFNVAQVYRGGVAAETLSSKISRLLEA